MSFGTVAAAYLSVVNNSLLAEWGFNEGSGATAADTSGNGYVAAVGGWTTGHTGSGAHGTGSMAGANLSSISWDTSTITLMGWFRFEESDAPALVLRDTENIVPSMALTLQSGDVWGSCGDDFVTTAGPGANTWVHLALAYSSTLALYVNGVLIGSVPRTASSGNANQLDIAGVAQWNWFNAQTADEVRVFDAALNSNDINTWMNTPIS